MLDGSPLPPRAWQGRPWGPVWGRKRASAPRPPRRGLRCGAWELGSTRSPQPASRLDFLLLLAAPGVPCQTAAWRRRLLGVWRMEVHRTQYGHAYVCDGVVHAYSYIRVYIRRGRVIDLALRQMVRLTTATAAAAAAVTCRVTYRLNPRLMRCSVQRGVLGGRRALRR